MADVIWQTEEYRDLIKRRTLATDHYAPKVGVVTLNGNATDANLTMRSNGATTNYRFGYNPISSFARYKDGLSSQSTAIKLTNLVTNGSFVDATGWTAYYGTGSVADNTYTLTGDGTQPQTLATTIAPVITIGHVYAITIKVMTTSANCYAIRARFGYTSQHVLVQSPVQNVEYQKTIIATAGVSDGNRFSIIAVYSTKEIASGKSICFQYVSCIDLTAAGINPTQEQVETTLATTEHSWFDGVGTFSVVAGGIQTLNCPSVVYPSAITSNLAAGTYKYVGIDGIYEFVLPAELHGIGTLRDRITFNEVSGIGSLTRGCSEIASYAGEPITTAYLSSTGALTTGANVVYVLPAETTEALTFTKVASSAATEVQFSVDWTPDVFYPTTFAVRYVTTIGGTEYTLDGSSIKQASSESSSVSGSTFSFGDFIGKTAEMTVYDIDGDYDEVSFEGASGVLSYGVKRSNGDYYWVSSGTYYVDDSNRSGTMVWISLADAKVAFDAVHTGAIGANQTLFQLAQAACTSAGITLGTVVGDLPNGTTVVTNSDTLMTVSPLTTDAMLVKYIAQATGTFAAIGRDNKLYFRWYEEVSPAYSVERNLISAGQSVADYEITTTGVSWTTTDGTKYSNGTSAYQLNVTNNPFSFADYATLLTGIAANVVGVSYVPVSFKWAGDPALDVGDIIVVPDRKGNAYSVPITTIRNSNTLSQAVKSVGESHLNNASVSISNSVTASIEDVRTLAKFGDIVADRIKTGTLDASLITVLNMVAQTFADDATSPDFYSRIGTVVLDGDTYKGFFGYTKISDSPETYLPSFQLISTVNEEASVKLGIPSVAGGIDFSADEGGSAIYALAADAADEEQAGIIAEPGDTRMLSYDANGTSAYEWGVDHNGVWWRKNYGSKTYVYT